MACGWTPRWQLLLGVNHLRKLPPFGGCRQLPAPQVPFSRGVTGKAVSFLPFMEPQTQHLARDSG